MLLRARESGLSLNSRRNFDELARSARFSSVSCTKLIPHPHNRRTQANLKVLAWSENGGEKVGHGSGGMIPLRAA
jgi:hypothetical protein